MSDWWAGLPPAEAVVDCGGQTHRLRWEAGRLLALDHDDAEGERTLAALGGERCQCVELLDAWERYATDARVLVLASRGPADPLFAPRDPNSGWFGYAPLGSSPMFEEPEPLSRLLRLQGGLPDRLVATVAAASARSTDPAVRPRLEAALYGRATATLRGWLAQPDLTVELEMVGAGAAPAVTRTDAGDVHAELPFAWVAEVWAKGLAQVMGRFCLSAATADGGRWDLTTVGPDLGPIETLRLSLGDR